MTGSLAVVGAGPKGIAVAAKARALAAAGYDAPRIVLVDRAGVAASWSGQRGFTSGRPPLGTPPEKDVGFPYADGWGAQSRAVTTAMAQFSWQRYLIERGLYADWVDHGRQRPTHRQWGAYLRAVADKLEAEVVVGEVVQLEVAGQRWRLTLDGGGVIEADGVLLSGTGPPETLPGQPREHPRVRDGRDYWLTGGDALAELRPQSVCVLGNGETAAAVVIHLLENLPRDATVEVLTSRGVLYSRGESYYENRLYSDPSDWPRLAAAHRREFLEHTDRGVFSQQAAETLNHARGFRTLAGRAVELRASDHQVVIAIEYGAERELVAYDLVVVAVGFDGRWFEPLLGAEAQARLGKALDGRDIELAIDVDLAVSGLSPPLHLPVLAGLAQGPGFPNLSCLGLLSDRVLRRYVALECESTAREEEGNRV
ncbi:MAG: mycobactin lysine-N-oxygenase [Gaiellales bacterium]|jgi:cation diffusion facilitator CzcD-associated flavoprotein CzcO|nr:mycobactin lysine-N-oxygenase [Gaiellales bacterium]